MTVDITPSNVAQRIAWLRSHAVGDYVKDADMLEALVARVAEVEAERDQWAKQWRELLSAGYEMKARAETAEAEVERLREALSEIVAHYELTSSRNPTMDRMAHEARAALKGETP